MHPITKFGFNICRLWRRPLHSSYHFRTENLDKVDVGVEQDEILDNILRDPYKHALPEKDETLTGFREASVSWEYVRRLLPARIIPTLQAKNDSATTPSGWIAPPGNPPDLPYYIRRGPNNLPTIFLERRRDELNPKTMDFEYVELVILRNIQGDIFACERDLRNYLENVLDHPVATHVDELKGLIKVGGADRTLIEQFVYDSESEFTR